MKHPYYQSHGATRNDVLSTDAAIREIADAFARGALSQPAAIQELREIGACEPEIAAIVA